jgi:hypothetical protein
MPGKQGGAPLPHTQVTVDSLPDCDFQPCSSLAAYDGATVYGPWANMCENHYAQHGRGLGLGRGQRLVLAAPDPKPDPLTVGAVLNHKGVI